MSDKTKQSLEPSKDMIKMGFLKIFLGKSLREIEHALPKDERKDAKKKSIDELVDDLLTHVCHSFGCEQRPEFDWSKLITEGKKVRKLIEDNRDIIEACMKQKTPPKK